MRRGQALPRAEMADLAMTMLEACEAPPGENLICLLQELLDVDRHRTAVANKHIEEFQKAAWIEAHYAVKGSELKLRELARLVNVAPANINLWRKSASYLKAIEDAKKALAFAHKEPLEAIKASTPDLSE